MLYLGIDQHKRQLEREGTHYRFLWCPNQDARTLNSPIRKSFRANALRLDRTPCWRESRIVFAFASVV